MIEIVSILDIKMNGKLMKFGMQKAQISPAAHITSQQDNTSWKSIVSAAKQRFLNTFLTFSPRTGELFI